eukprot:gnl/TRDRNA2_/TRDRNA2_176094_c1_seq6.p1 gnl/TRDRNA2_/TRDRNA2_176094_c1~~gnl/TRDRNA2_/TRDRNA2_176094_c1_seq6.p1  ORF type:complete len:373 (+),score=25.15 gnl/TRDRNA2_/TRDRNA2_176094_c1_seq6:2-1120(+)
MKSVLQRLLGSTGCAVVQLDMDFRICKPCPEFANLLLRGYNSDSLLNTSFATFIVPDDVELFEDYMVHEASLLDAPGVGVSNDQRASPLRLRLLDVSHAKVSVQLFFACLKDSNGCISYILGVQKDIDEAAQSLPPLSESRQSHVDLMHHVSASETRSHSSSTSIDNKIEHESEQSLEVPSETFSDSGDGESICPDPVSMPQATINAFQNILSTNTQFDLLFGRTSYAQINFSDLLHEEHRPFFLQELEKLSNRMYHRDICVGEAHIWNVDKISARLMQGSRQTKHIHLVNLSLRFEDPEEIFGSSDPEDWNMSQYPVLVSVTWWKRLPKRASRARAAREPSRSAQIGTPSRIVSDALPSVPSPTLLGKLTL